jgi:dUTP pyrophosphatase
MIIQIKKTHPAAIVPRYAHNNDAGCDLFSIEPTELEPGQRKLIRTGIAIALPPHWEAQIRPKSGLALEHGITVLNAPGTIDAGYTGEIKVILINHSIYPYLIRERQKIAQMVFAEVAKGKFIEVAELTATDRSDRGFGSTGLTD